MSDAWTVRRLLEWTTSFLTKKGVEKAWLDADLLLGTDVVAQLPREGLVALRRGDGVQQQRLVQLAVRHGRPE